MEEAEPPNNPSFVFLQLFHSAALSLPPAPGHAPLLLSADEVRVSRILSSCHYYISHRRDDTLISAHLIGDYITPISYIIIISVVVVVSPQATTRAVKQLDRIPPYNTHKIGVVYVGWGQVSQCMV